MYSFGQIIAGGLLVFLAADAVGAETNGFRRQVVTLPLKGMESCFARLGNEGRLDLLAVDPIKERLWIYRQRAAGFPDAPDQVLDLPPKTAWISPYPVEAHQGIDLLMSTGTGFVYYRQNDGVFESKPHTLAQADQIFTNGDPAALVSLAPNGGIPVISETQAWEYERSNDSTWRRGAPMALAARQNKWSVRINEWTLGPNSARNLDIQQTVLSQPDEANEKPENDAIAKLMGDLKRNADQWHQPGVQRVDLNGNGRKDFIVWQTVGDFGNKTDFYVFLRGPDGKLPERPTQVLHCRGIPFPIGSTKQPMPVADLKGDGAKELVLMEPEFMAALSAGNALDAAFSRGVKIALAIRTFNHGAFSPSPEATVPLRVLLSFFGARQWPFFICGDFNGDGRPDLAIQDSSTRWNVLSSTDDGRWFDPHPAMTFEIPMQGYFEKLQFEINDLNGDGRSDIVLRDSDDPRIFIFLTQPRPKKGNH